jgi:hypothetical protein
MAFGVDKKDGSGHCRQLASNLTLDGGESVKVMGGTAPLFARLERGEIHSFFFYRLCDHMSSHFTGSSSSFEAASDAHAGVRLVLSRMNFTDTKALELKSLQDGIANQLERRREELALLQAEAKTLNDRMQSLASSFLP